ncbi:unnamed protein product [Spodoptera littoralis]|uniref:Uncharacterized protein n=1 Tax=Spodoptera littoralis TaxID=7109 RepID=A0A9P0I9Y2_SPOLI|nr:unnamed protein product [Spodoptera littoralis]CAH1642912.1 unnamed protein product [Spodoptera littoralis]
MILFFQNVFSQCTSPAAVVDVPFGLAAPGLAARGLTSPLGWAAPGLAANGLITPGLAGHVLCNAGTNGLAGPE